jgi:hypothetical protein
MDAEDRPIPFNSLIHFITFPKLRDLCPAGALLTPTEKITELGGRNRAARLSAAARTQL